MPSDGVRLRVRKLGGSAAGARVVIVVHGGPGLDLEAMDSLNALATPSRALVGYDQRGAGRSTRPTNGDYGLDAQLADLEAVRRWTGAARVDLMGASFGALLAAAYTARMPQHVDRLVLLDPAPLDLPEFLAGQDRFGERQLQLQAEGLIPDPLPTGRDDSCVAMVQALMPAYLGDPHEKPPAHVLNTCTASTSQATYLAIKDRGRLDDVAAGLANFTGPALIVDGELSPFGRGWGDRAQQLLAAAHVERLRVPGAGHISYAEKPAAVLPAINRFLS